MSQNDAISKMDSTVTSLLYQIGFEAVSRTDSRYYCRSLLSMQDTVERMYCFVGAGLRCYREYLLRDKAKLSAWVIEIPEERKNAFSAAVRRAEMMVKPVMGGRLPINDMDRNKPLAPFNPTASGTEGQAGVHFIHVGHAGVKR